MESYSTACPHCGAQLEVVVQHAGTAPWLCRTCRTGWWAAELTRAARDTYRRERRDHRPAKPVREAVTAERQLAVQRGSSMREDQVRYVHPRVLERLDTSRMTDSLKTAIAAHLKGTP